MVRFRLNDALAFGTIDETEGLLFDAATMATFSLNETGLWLVEQAKMTDDLVDTNVMAVAFADNFDVELEQARQDIADFCEELCRRGLAHPC